MKNTILIYLQTFHLFLLALFNTYIFWRKYVNEYVFDRVYLILFILVPILWIVFKNECVISYIEKKAVDPSYQNGQRPYHNPSFDIFVDTSKDSIQYTIFRYLTLLFTIINAAFVLYYLGLIWAFLIIFIIIGLYFVF